ncbi:MULTISPECIES: type IV pilus modification PilV family protein [Salinicola]|uniref:type IV pilus modification PilV family protein n=1 Tax=Salinicola salarius TaxID=430457 RepID=UPI0015C638B3|nr:prepilin-type N-terminal cleavage/methylation domain-containing protein [Salinicola salarius]
MLALQRGLSLIEVLIAIVVFSIGLLGAAKLLAEQGQLGQETGHRALASIMAEDLLQRIKLDSLHRDDYLGRYDSSSITSDNPDSSLSLKAWAADWFGAGALPDPQVCAELEDGNEMAFVTVVWRARTSFVPPDTLPDCVSSRSNLSNQRWVTMASWVGEK